MDVRSYSRAFYPNLYEYNYSVGIHRAPAEFEDNWVVVGRYETIGAHTRREARHIWNTYRELLTNVEVRSCLRLYML